MSAGSKTVQWIERALLYCGLVLLVLFGLAHLHGAIMVRLAIAKFESARSQPAATNHKQAQPGKSADDQAEAQRVSDTDTTEWSTPRVRLYESTLTKAVEPLAILRIPALRLEVPVLDGTDKFTLNRGVGRITGTSKPGQQGNIGIAGHRDGFFRGLRDLQVGDTIELVTTSGTDVYVVDHIRITGPSDVSVLRPRSPPSLTLVTCYPFYFVGPAPNRYVVQASLR